MGIIRFAIDNPVKVAVGVILLTLFGVLSVLRVPVQLTPDVDKPVITVTTRWTGASPQEIESEIVDRQEDKLKSVANLKKMSSSSTEGEALITLEFPVGIDKDVAYRDVSDKLRQVTDYPEEVDEPTISATDDQIANTIAWLILRSRDGRSISHLKTFVEDQVKPQLERAEGISEVDIFGGLDREIQVEIDAHKLAARGLTFRDVERALRRQNENISAGTIAGGKREVTYRTVGEYTSTEEIENTVIVYQPSGPVFVRDVAQVVDGLKKQYAFVRNRGAYTIAMPAKREIGFNVIEAMRNLQERIDVVNREVLPAQGQDLELIQVYDETDYIWGAINLVRDNILEGGLLAIIVLWLFLRSGSATGIVAVAIPISVVGAFLVIAMLGRSLNVIMLAGMAFAVGNSIDNAIVVLENIYRHRGMGKSRKQAALDGAGEVWGAVMASTATSVAVFLPVIFIQEEAGQLFKDIAIASVAAAALSLVVSILVIPPLTARFFAASSALETGDKPWKPGIWASMLVRRIERSVAARIAVVFGLTAFSVIGSRMLMPGTEYLPSGNQNLIFGFILSPPGYSVDEFKRMGTIVEEGDPLDPLDGVRPMWEAQLGTAQAEALPPVDMPLGGGDAVATITPPPIDNFFYVAFSGRAFMGATSKEPTNVRPLQYVLNRAGSRIPGVFAIFSQKSLFASGLSGNSVDVEVRSDDYKAVVASATAIRGRLLEAGYEYPNPEPANFDLGRPEVRLVPDRAKAADLRLDVADIGFIVEACVDGAFVGEYNDRGDKIDMALTVAGTKDATPDQIGQIPMYTPSGHIVPIASAVDLQRTTAPQQINHVEEMKSVTLKVKPKAGVPLQDAMIDIEQNIVAPLRAEGIVPQHVIAGMAGNADKLTQTQRSLVGDFRGSLARPSLFGWSVPLSLAFITVLAAMSVTGLRIVLGVRAAAIAGVAWFFVIVVGVLVLNPALALTVLQSRTVLALLVTYLLMAALFESYLYPFVMMFSVPPAALGGLAALWVVYKTSLYSTHLPVQQLDMLTMLGFVILIGIVVNNAILIVHQALNFMREDNLAPNEAVAMSVMTRTRPIFMTALTSIFGLLPLVIMPGAGSELYRGMGSVLLGGLLVSTLFTLVVIPAMFTLFLDFKAWLAAALSGERDAARAAARAGANGREAETVPEAV